MTDGATVSDELEGRPEQIRHDRRSSSVGLGLIHWNSGELTRRCIDSVMAGTSTPARIAIFDNGSSDNALRSLLVSQPGIAITRSERNLGFAHAANKLMEILLSEGHDYIWLLNNDTLVATRALEALWSAMECDDSLGGCSGRIMWEKDPGRAWYAGGRLDHRTIEGVHNVHSATGGEGVVPVDFMSGCCMLLRAGAVRRVGPFDETFFAYCEDTDWCFRAKSARVRLGYVPAATIYHAVSGSVRRATLGNSRGTASAFQQFLTVRSMALLIRKHASSRVARSLLLAGLSLRALPIMFGQFILGRFEKMPAVLMGILHGIRDRLGEPLNPAVVARFTPPLGNTSREPR